MFIVPLNSSIAPVESFFDKEASSPVGEQREGFTGVFKEIFAEVLETNRASAEDNARMTMGDIDDLHTLYNNMTKAQVSVETLVALKNTTIEAYEKVMNMQI
jgi:flagellar hook-basal body complex protein FliE